VRSDLIPLSTKYVLQSTLKFLHVGLNW